MSAGPLLPVIISELSILGYPEPSGIVWKVGPLQPAPVDKTLTLYPFKASWLHTANVSSSKDHSVSNSHIHAANPVTLTPRGVGSNQEHPI